MNEAIAAARAAVNAQTFGTPAWESAMQIVRGLVSEQMASAPRSEYTSIDGNVFNEELAQLRASNDEGPMAPAAEKAA